jgi:hypothetical protein
MDKTNKRIRLSMDEINDAMMQASNHITSNLAQ